MTQTEYTYLADGMAGMLYDTQTDADSLIIVLCESKRRAKACARALCVAGYPALALYLRGSRGWNRQLRDIPLEMVSRAIDRMRSGAYRVFYLYGEGYGAALACHACARLTQISGLICVSPFASLAESRGRFLHVSGHPMARWEGLALPGVSRKHLIRTLYATFMHTPRRDKRRYSLRYLYHLVLAGRCTEQTMVPLMQCRCRCLLISGGRDRRFPAAQQAEKMAALVPPQACTLVHDPLSGHRIMIPGGRLRQLWPAVWRDAWEARHGDAWQHILQWLAQ